MTSHGCRHLHYQGAYAGHRCGEKVSKLDPENRYCAKHRLCVFLVKDKVTKPDKEPLKFINYITFCASMVTDDREFEEVAAWFEK
jgi:hypothetical protein